MTVPTQHIGFPGNSVPLSEAQAMLNAVSQDAHNTVCSRDRNDLESLRDWLEETINSQLVSVKQ